MNPCEKAQEGLGLLKEAIIELLEQNSSGLTNAEIAKSLEIRSDYKGSQKDYLSWSVLGLLMNEGIIKREGRKYKIV